MHVCVHKYTVHCIVEECVKYHMRSTNFYDIICYCVVQVMTSNPEVLMFAGVTFSSGLPLLITIKLGAKVTINSEKMVINGMLLKVVQTALTT